MSGMTLNSMNYFSYSNWNTHETSYKTLWQAVALQAVKDMEHQLEACRREIRRYGYASFVHQTEINKTLIDIYDPWFQVICLEADLDHGRIIKMITNLLDSYGYNKMPFGLMPDRKRRYRLYKKKSSSRVNRL